MKNLSILIILFSNVLFSQMTTKKEDVIRAEVLLPIWDAKNSDLSLKIVKLMYDEIPKSIDFRGTVVSALSWADASGDNILIISKSGVFEWKDFNVDSSEFDIQDKSELFVYLFQKEKDSGSYEKLWRIYDYIDCFGVDMYAGFKNVATTITDLDGDEIAEVAIPYALYCRGGMDPGVMKIIMYEGTLKYALRGETAICKNGEVLYGGEYTADKATSKNKVYNDFLMRQWETHKCE